MSKRFIFFISIEKPNENYSIPPNFIEFDYLNNRIFTLEDDDFIKERLIQNNFKKLKKFYIQSGFIVCHPKFNQFPDQSEIVSSQDDSIRIIDLRYGSSLEHIKSYCFMYPFIVFAQYNESLLEEASSEFHRRYPVKGTSSCFLYVPTELLRDYQNIALLLTLFQPLLCPYLKAPTRYARIVSSDVTTHSSTDEKFVRFVYKDVIDSFANEIPGIEGIDDFSSFQKSKRIIIQILLAALDVEFKSASSITPEFLVSKASSFTIPQELSNFVQKVISSIPPIEFKTSPFNFIQEFFVQLHKTNLPPSVSNKVLYPIYIASIEMALMSTFKTFSSRYHSSEEILNNLQIQHPSLSPFYTVETLPNSKIQVFQPVLSPSLKTLRVMIVCGQHGRELVSSELCYALISLIQGKISDLDCVNLYQHLRKSDVAFYILPIVNQYARDQAFFNKQCARTNANGVDLNRNFPSDFKKPRNMPPPGNEEYGGQYPLSEPESLDIDHYMSRIKPHVVLNVHSGGNAVLMPYDADVIKTSINYKHVIHILNSLRNAHPSTFDFKIGPSSIMYYPSYGTLMDYSLDFKQVDIAVTLEIFSNRSLSSSSLKDNCLAFFNPIEGIDLSKLIEKWIYFILLFTKKIHNSIIF